MTTKVNGVVEQGRWFERDTTIIHVASDHTNFSFPVAVGGQTEETLQILATRGTIIGYTVVNAQNIDVMFGHAAGSWDVDVLPELKAMLDAALVAGITLTEFSGFTGVDPLTA